MISTIISTMNTGRVFPVLLGLLPHWTFVRNRVDLGGEKTVCVGYKDIIGHGELGSYG